MTGYLAAVLADSPFHYWRMADAAGGLAFDIGSSPLHLHGLGTAIAPVMGYAGPNNDGGSCDLSLDGQYMNTGQPVTLQVNPFTMEACVWIWQSLTVTRHIWQIQSANQIALFRNGAAWSFTYNGATMVNAAAYTAQKWHHVVGTYDGVHIQLYVDSNPGVAVAIGPQAALAVISEISTNLGLTTFGGSYYSELAYYHTALSQTRVSAHFAALDNVNQAPISKANGSGGIIVPPYGQDLADIKAGLFTRYTNTP